VVSDEQIAEVMSDRGVPLEQICQRLIEAANNGGGPDNITALVLEVNAP
jgi:serine/threonine protein phosphatase PrpC